MSIDIAHRTGRYVPNKSKQIIVKLSSIEDKHNIMKNSKRMLSGQPCYIVDDLTQQDLKENRKWLPNITTLYENGTKLRFSAGKWRKTQGIPYSFDKNNIAVID